MATRKVFSISSTIKLNSGNEMPLLGIGVFKSTDALSSCKYALEAGYRHIDSARAYKNEAAVGEAVQKSGIPRNSLFLTTKVTGKEHGYENCTAALEGSSKVAGIEGYWDLILLHDPTAGKEKRLGAYKALVEAYEAGKARTIGVSNYGVAHLEELAAANLGPTPAINQIELHPWCQQKPIVEYCNAKGIIVQAYCPLVRAKYMDDPTLVSISKEVCCILFTAIPDKPAQPNRVFAVFSDSGASPRPMVAPKGYSPLPKSDNQNRIIENAGVYDFDLSDEAMEKLDALDKGDTGAISWNPVHHQ